MRKNIYLLLSLTLVSCYTYQVKKPATAVVETKQLSSKTIPTNMDIEMGEKEAIQNFNTQQSNISANIQEKLSANKNVKIDVNGKSYKIIVDRWESDSLVAHSVHNSKQILKFHKNQINPENIAEKRFSQPIADIITVVVYAGIGVGIWSLLK